MGSLQRLAIRQRQTPSRNLHTPPLSRCLCPLLEIERRRRGYGVCQRRTRRTNRSGDNKTQDHTPPANQPVPSRLHSQHQTLQHPIRQLHTNRKPCSQKVRPRILSHPRQERIRLQTEHYPAILRKRQALPARQVRRRRMSILPLYPRPRRPVRQLRPSTRPERSHQSILCARPQHTRNERISQLVLRPPKTNRPIEKVRRGEPKPPGEC